METTTMNYSIAVDAGQERNARKPQRFPSMTSTDLNIPNQHSFGLEAEHMQIQLQKDAKFKTGPTNY